MGFPSSTLVLLIFFFFFFITFLIDFHWKTSNSGFLVLASTDSELIQDNSNVEYELVSSKKLLLSNNKKIERSRVSRVGGGRVSVPGSPIGNKNRQFFAPSPPPEVAISQLHH